MSSKWLWYFLFLSLTLSAHAQEGYIDSLKKSYRPTLPDSSKAVLYNRIFFNYIFFQLDSAYHYASLSFAYGSKVHYPKGLATYYNNVGILNRVEGDYTEAINNLLQSLKINEEIGNKLGIADNYVNIGLVYAAQKKHELALSYYQKCLDIKLKTNDAAGIGYCYRDMCDTYMAMGNYDKAITHYHQCIHLSTKRRGVVYRAIMSLGFVYTYLEQWNKAEQQLLESLPGLEKEEAFELATAYNALGKVAEKKYTPEKAIGFYERK